jgi:hypothetical protein
MKNTQNQNPDTVAQFDFEEVERRLGEAVEDVPESDRGLMADALKQILRFILGRHYRSESGRETIARRAIALAWVIDPSLFGAKPSLTALGKQLGLHKVLLSEHAAEASRRFGIQNSQQAKHYPA